MKIKSNWAFTLAEVLITLGIIGVVAALTIPSIISSYQKVQYVEGLKKGYSEISQVFKKYIAEEGVADLAQTKLFSSEDNYDELKKIITKNFKIVKECDYNVASCELFDIVGRFLSYTGSFDTFKEFNTNYYNFCTVDNVCIGIQLDASGDCKSGTKGTCCIIRFDVNGTKPPNRAGRDFFYSLNMTPDVNLLPTGGPPDTGGDSYWQGSGFYACGTPGSSEIPAGLYGSGCIARVIEEGWKMNY